MCDYSASRLSGQSSRLGYQCLQQSSAQRPSVEITASPISLLQPLTATICQVFSWFVSSFNTAAVQMTRPSTARHKADLERNDPIPFEYLEPSQRQNQPSQTPSSPPHMCGEADKRKHHTAPSIAHHSKNQAPVTVDHPLPAEACRPAIAQSGR